MGTQDGKLNFLDEAANLHNSIKNFLMEYVKTPDIFYNVSFGRLKGSINKKPINLPILSDCVLEEASVLDCMFDQSVCPLNFHECVSEMFYKTQQTWAWTSNCIHYIDRIDSKKNLIEREVIDENSDNQVKKILYYRTKKLQSMYVYLAQLPYQMRLVCLKREPITLDEYNSLVKETNVSPRGGSGASGDLADHNDDDQEMEESIRSVECYTHAWRLNSVAYNTDNYIAATFFQEFSGLALNKSISQIKSDLKSYFGLVVDPSTKLLNKKSCISSIVESLETVKLKLHFVPNLEHIRQFQENQELVSRLISMFFVNCKMFIEKYTDNMIQLETIESSVKKEIANMINSKAYYYPSFVGDIISQTRQHYNVKYISRASFSSIETLRRLNNEVKYIIIEAFAPPPPTSLSILDLACGHGQDIQKYRNKLIKLYHGVDVAEKEIQEANRRLQRRNIAGDWKFVVGNILKNTTYTNCASENDIISCQLAIHYCVEIKKNASFLFEKMASLAKNGAAVFISTISCYSLAELLIPQFKDNRIVLKERYVIRNSVYNITFDTKSLVEAILTYTVTFKMSPSTDYTLEQVLTFYNNNLSQVSSSSKSETLSDGFQHIGGINNKIDHFNLKKIESINAPSLQTLISTFENIWGISYLYKLIEHLNTDEFIVPHKAFVELAAQQNLNLVRFDTFGEILAQCETITNGVRPWSLGHLSFDTQQMEAFSVYAMYVFSKGPQLSFTPRYLLADNAEESFEKPPPPTDDAEASLFDEPTSLTKKGDSSESLKNQSKARTTSLWKRPLDSQESEGASKKQFIGGMAPNLVSHMHSDRLSRLTNLSGADKSMDPTVLSSENLPSNFSAKPLSKKEQLAIQIMKQQPPSLQSVKPQQVKIDNIVTQQIKKALTKQKPKKDRSTAKTPKTATAAAPQLKLNLPKVKRNFSSAPAVSKKNLLLSYGVVVSSPQRHPKSPSKRPPNAAVPMSKEPITFSIAALPKTRLPPCKPLNLQDDLFSALQENELDSQTTQNPLETPLHPSEQKKIEPPKPPKSPEEINNNQFAPQKQAPAVPLATDLKQAYLANIEDDSSSDSSSTLSLSSSSSSSESQ